MNDAVAFHRYTATDLARALGDTAQTSPPKQQPLDNQLKIYDVRDFLALEVPARDDILARWLPAQGLIMVYAPRGVNNTFVHWTEPIWLL
jgi:hypothetical protein